MAKNEIENYGKSNRTKLLNLSKQIKGADYKKGSGGKDNKKCRKLYKIGIYFDYFCNFAAER